jgi:hypothetical protein
MRNSAASIVDCIIEGNQAPFGGGLYALYCTGTIERCTIRDNSADAFGGGVLLFGCQMLVSDSAIVENTAVTAGGGLHLVQGIGGSGAPQLERCTVSQNFSFDRGGGISWDPASGVLQIVECAVSGNAATAGGGIFIYPTIQASRTSLVDTSVCGNSQANIDGYFTRDESTVVCNCVGDINRDGIVNGADLGQMLAQWGTGGGAFPATDANQDGVVNGSDLGLLLGAWGTCPG